MPEPVRAAVIACEESARLRAWLPAFIAQDPAAIADLLARPAPSIS